jgi:2-oxoglutarate ferredoxin oxidoreductase subunit beta
VNTYDWFKENIVRLDQLEGYDPSDRIMAMKTAMQYNGMVVGLIYQNTNQPSYEQLVPGFKEEALAKQPLELDEAHFNKLVAEFM